MESAHVVLSTAPDPYGATHWGQQCFWLYPGAVVSDGDSLQGEMHMQRNKENHRLMDVVFKFSHMRVVDGKEFAAPPRTAPYHIE
jgi:protein arginine N-methyltransferase 1